jgi:hypothetical protein
LEGELFDEKGKTRVVQSAINGQFSKIKQINVWFDLTESPTTYTADL